MTMKITTVQKWLNEMNVVFFVIVLLLVQSKPTLADEGIDLTLKPGSGGSYVVDAVIGKIQEHCLVDFDNGLLQKLAFLRSNDGKNYTLGTGGIWQVSNDQLSTVNMECSTSLRSGCLEARSLFGVDLAITKMEDLDKPLVSGMVMAFYVTSQSRVNEAGIAEQLKFSSESLDLGGEEFFELSAQLRLCPASQLDVTFIIDGSGSVRENNFAMIVNFLREMVGDMDIQPDNVRMSVIQLSTNATLVMSMDDFRDDTDLEAAFQRMRFTGGYTDTAKAIDLAVSVASNSSMNNRINKAAKVFVLVGDLRSKNISDAISAAMRAKEMDFEIFVLGVGNSVVGQLKAFASPPTCKHLSLLDSYFELYLSVNQLQKGLCEAAAVVDLISKDNANFDFNTLPADSNSTKLQILKINVPQTERSEKYIGSKHIAIKVKTTCGNVNMYASYDISKPGRGFHSYSAVATDLMPGELFANSSFDGRPLFVTIIARNANESCAYSHYNISIVDEVAVPNPCRDQNGLYFPHPRKDMFIQCDLWGEAFEMSCSPHTFWDQSSLACITMFNSGAMPKTKPSNFVQRSSESTEPATLKVSATSRHNNDTDDISTTEPPKSQSTILTVLTSTIKSNTFENPCTPSALAAGKYYHPHPEPQKYIHCDQSGNFNIQKCGPGTVWIQSQMACNFPIYRKTH